MENSYENHIKRVKKKDLIILRVKVEVIPDHVVPSLSVCLCLSLFVCLSVSVCLSLSLSTSIALHFLSTNILYGKILSRKKFSQGHVFATLRLILENVSSGKLSGDRNIVKTKSNDV